MIVSRGREFVVQAELVIRKLVGQLVAASILKNQLTKLRKDIDAISADDCNTLIQNIINALSLFVTKEEAYAAHSELNRLFKEHFA